MFKSKEDFVKAVETCYPVFKNKNLSFFLWAEIANICLCIVVLKPEENAILVEDIKETIKFAVFNEHFPWD